MIEGEIDGMAYDDEYDGCIGCSAKVKGDDKVLGECTKCSMIMKWKKCKKIRDGYSDSVDSGSDL